MAWACPALLPNEMGLRLSYGMAGLACRKALSTASVGLRRAVALVSSFPPALPRFPSLSLSLSLSFSQIMSLGALLSDEDFTTIGKREESPLKQKAGPISHQSSLITVFVEEEMLPKTASLL